MLLQKAAIKAKSTGVRWDPLFIRWCLNIMLTSSKAYEIIQESGFVCLPSRRTLRDYTNWMQLKPGYNAEVLNYIRNEFKINELPAWKRSLVAIVYVVKTTTILLICRDGQ